jgi:hypothetical protein
MRALFVDQDGAHAKFTRRWQVLRRVFDQERFACGDSERIERAGVGGQFRFGLKLEEANIENQGKCRATPRVRSTRAACSAGELVKIAR